MTTDLKEQAEAKAYEVFERFENGFENPKWRAVVNSYLSGAAKASAAEFTKNQIATKALKQAAFVLVDLKSRMSNQFPSEFNMQVLKKLDIEIKSIQDALKQMIGISL